MRLGKLKDRVTEGGTDRDFLDRYADLGARVAARRAALALSQQELAELCGTTQSAIARLEAGRRAARIDTLLRVAHALDCELEIDFRPRTRSRSDS